MEFSPIIPTGHAHARASNPHTRGAYAHVHPSSSHPNAFPFAWD